MYVSEHVEMLPMRRLTPAQHDDVEAMGRGVGRLRALTGLLLSFLRRGGGGRRRLRVTDVVRRALDVCSYVLQHKSIDVTCDLPDLPPVLGNGPLLEGVVINLVDNAVRAMRHGGHLHLSARRSSGGVELIVQDDGAGMAPELLARVFECRSAPQLADEGRGIGLAFARQVMERHGGALTAESSVGAGTTFALWLPTSAEPAEPDRGVTSPRR